MVPLTFQSRQRSFLKLFRIEFQQNPNILQLLISGLAQYSGQDVHKCYLTGFFSALQWASKVPSGFRHMLHKIVGLDPRTTPYVILLAELSSAPLFNGRTIRTSIQIINTNNSGGKFVIIQSTYQKLWYKHGFQHWALTVDVLSVHTVHQQWSVRAREGEKRSALKFVQRHRSFGRENKHRKLAGNGSSWSSSQYLELKK